MKYFISTIYLLIPFLLLAQGDLQYQVSKPFRVIDGAEKYYFTKWDNEKQEKGKLLSVKRDGKDIYMQYFDAVAMQEIKRTKCTDMPDGFVIEDMAWVGKKAYCFFSVWDKKNRTEQLFYRELDFDNCSFKAKEKRMIATVGKLDGAAAFTYGFFSFGVINKFGFVRSRDRSKIMIQYRKVPEKKRDAVSYDLIGLYVFDAEMNKLSGGEVSMPYTEKVMDNIDFQVNADGNIYFLAKVRNDDSAKDTRGVGKNKTINHHFELFDIDPDNNKIKISKIDLEGYHIKEIILYEDNSKNLVCAGFYKRLLQKSGVISLSYSVYSDGNADGLFLFNIDKDGTVVNKRFYEIPVDVINQYQRKGAQNRNEKKEEKGKADMAYLELREIITQTDGSLILIGEQYYVVERRSSRGTVYYSYYYEDILVTKIDPEGQLAWMKKLPKRQVGGRAPGGMSYSYSKLNNDHYFIFVDNDKNMALSLDKRPASHVDGRGGFLTAYQLKDQTGKVEKHSIFEAAKVDGGYKVKQFSVNRISKISDSEVIIELYKGQKEDIMIKVKAK